MSGYLLDTRTALWCWTGLPNLGQRAREVLETTQERILFSTVSSLEVALKWRRGKLLVLGDPRDSFDPLMARNSFIELRVSSAHALRAGMIDSAQRDPFDRLIAAQALIEDMTVITRDREIAGLGAKVLW